MPTNLFSSDAEIERIWFGLRDRSLPKSQWTHAAHFAAAIWRQRHGDDKSVSNDLARSIRAYNKATGVPNTDSNGYHETITLASLAAARAVLALHSPSEPMHTIVNALMASPLGRSEWLLSYWSKELLFSARARRVWTPSDIHPFPFALTSSCNCDCESRGK